VSCSALAAGRELLSSGCWLLRKKYLTLAARGLYLNSWATGNGQRATGNGQRATGNGQRATKVRVTIMTTATYATVKVFERGRVALMDKVDALNKRAARYGMNTMEARIVRVDGFVPLVRGKSLTRFPQYSFGCTENHYCIEITGCAPRINGWRLVARVEFNADIGNIVRIAPGVDDDGSFVAYRTIGPVCEHCNTNRRRNDVFVIEHESGQRKVIGRNCLADYLRCEDANDFVRLAEYADFIKEACDAAERDDMEYFGGGWVASNMPLERYLTIVRMLTRRIGWISRTAARENGDGSSTADDAYRYIFSNDRYTKAWIARNELETCADDEAEALCAIEWACNVGASRSEYLDTIQRIALSGSVSFGKLDGYAASIIIAYRKACERDRERAEKAKNAKNKVWFGREKDRVRDLQVTCKGLHSFEGYYGVTTIVRFEHSVSDTDKAVLVWFASGDRYDDWEVDAEYTIDATIKGHDDHETYGKQTKINRVKSK
jgi:hypothetical protein